MAVIDIPIVGQSYHLKDWSIDCQRTLNLYPQVVESGNAPQVSALLPTEGLVERYKLSGAIRGIYALADSILVVAGSALHKIKDGNTQEIGEITGTGLVSFADNSLQVMIVADDAYSYKIKDEALERLIIDDDTGFFGASTVTFLDSRFIWTVPNTGRIQWSGLLNTETTALNYATAESKSDDLVRVIASNGQLWLIGTRTAEIWNSTGSQDLPYQRQSGAYIPVGCIAKDSIAVFGSSLIWLAQTEHGDNQIVMTQGYQTQRISNHAIETELSSYARTDDAYAFSYQQQGHSFYFITFPTAQKTWVFDATTQMWHERSFYNSKTAAHTQHRASVHCFFEGEHLVGDYENGLIYRLCPNAQSDNGNVIIRERTTPCINPQGARMIFDELELICQVGQDDNIKPLIMLDWSDDGGRTWSHVSQIDLGGIGEYRKRVIVRRLGQSFNRVFRVRMSDAAKLILLGAKAKVR